MRKALLTLALFAAGCGAGENPATTSNVAAFDKAAAEREIAQTLETYKAAVVKGDSSGAFSYFSRDAHVYEPGNNIGYNEIHALYQSVFAANDIRDFQLDVLETFAYEDAAYQIAVETGNLVNKKDGKVTPIKMNVFIRWVKDPASGRWLFSRVVEGPVDAPKS